MPNSRDFRSLKDERNAITTRNIFTRQVKLLKTIKALYTNQIVIVGMLHRTDFKIA